MIYIKEYTLTTERDALLDITKQVEEAIGESGADKGTVTVETAHSTAGILKAAADPDVLYDIIKEMRRNIPARINFRHQDAPEDAAGHIKNCLFGSSVTAILKDGKLYCSDKQHIFFADYDGPRQRTFCVCVSGE